MKFLNNYVLFSLFSILLNTNMHAADAYSAIRANVHEKYPVKIEHHAYNIENGQFVLSNKNSESHFNSLRDFYILDAQGDYKHILQSVPLDGFKYLGYGKDDHYYSSGQDFGQLILGKALTPKEIEQIKYSTSQIVFKGFSLNNPFQITLVFNPENGTVQGSMDRFSIESSPKAFDGTIEAKLYYQKITYDGPSGQRNGTRKVYGGKMILTLYGAGENLEMGGAYTCSNNIAPNYSGLVVLKRE